MRKFNEALLALIQTIHFNKDFPENHNIRYYKQNRVHVKMNDEWVEHNMKFFIPDLIEKTRKIFVDLMCKYDFVLPENFYEMSSHEKKWLHEKTKDLIINGLSYQIP